MANIQGGSNTLNVANVTGSNLQVSLSNDPIFIGGARNFSENDAGTIMGVPRLRSPETSSDYRLRVGTDSVFDNEFFNYAAQNTSKHRYANTTMTNVWGGGFVTTNGTSITTVTTATLLQTYRNFPLFTAGATYCHFGFALSNQPTTNTTIDIGLYTPGAANPFTPADGIFFRINSAGIFGVINVNGTEITTNALNYTVVVNEVREFIIVVKNNGATFWIDDVLYASLDAPVTVGSPALAGSLPFCMRHAIVAGVAGAVLQGKLAYYHVSLADFSHNRLWPTVQAGMGNNSIQGASGHTQGQSSNNVNNTAPASATLANATAGYTTLGGQFQFAAPVGSETDYALFAFQNPVLTTAITGRNLVIRGIWIDTFVMGAVSATTATLLQWSLGVGATAVTLLTAEAATTRATRRISLGAQSIAVATPIGGRSSNEVDVNLDAPLVVEPGTFLHVILKTPVGTATASQIIRGVVGINAFWE